jgi:hypothetical protein
MNNYESTIVNHLKQILGTRSLQQEDVNASHLDEILEVARIQGVGATLFPVLNKKYKEKALHSQKWKIMKDHFFDATLKNVLFMKQIKELLHCYEQHNISPIILKGISIGRLYQHPEYRLMCDLDIYVRSNEWDQAKEILISNGYLQTEPDDYNILHIEFQKENAITVELHRNLIHTDYLGARDKDRWYNQLWERRNKVVLKNMEFYAMSAEDELIHQITHFASHFVYYGTKVKHLFEMSLIIKSHEDHFDWSYLAETLKTIGFFEFGCLLLSVCKKFFYIDVAQPFLTVDVKIINHFMSDLFNYYSYEKQKGDFESWFHVVSRVKPKFNYIIYQPLIWMLIAKAQYKIHGLKLPFILNNSIRNIMVANKKIKVIRNFRLSSG